MRGIYLIPDLYNLKDEVAKSRFKVMIWGALATMAMVSGLHIGQYKGT